MKRKRYRPAVEFEYRQSKTGGWALIANFAPPLLRERPKVPTRRAAEHSGDRKLSIPTAPERAGRGTSLTSPSLLKYCTRRHVSQIFLRETMGSVGLKNPRVDGSIPSLATRGFGGGAGVVL